jgi:hypothetical protein
MEVIHDLRGGAYVPYIAEETFRILRTGGGQLRPYTPEGFDHTLLGARALSVSSGGLEQYTAFIGRKGGRDAVYLFGLNYQNDLTYYPLDETSAPAISDYALVPSPGGSLQVYTLAGGRLHCLSAGRDGSRVLREISPGDEPVEAFAVHRKRNQKTAYGWYRVYRDDQWELTFFSLDEAGYLVRGKTGKLSGLPRLECRVSPQGDSVFTIISGSNVSVYHFAGSSLVRDLNFEAPLKVQRYGTSLQTEGSAGLLTGRTETEELFYAVTQERSGAPALNPLFSLRPGELVDVYLTGTNRISLVYRRDQTVRTALIGMDGRIITEGRLPLAEETDGLFYPDMPGEKRLYAFTRGREGELGRLSLFSFEKERWNLLREIPVPRAPGGELHSLSPFNKDNELLLLVSPDSLALCETGSLAYQSVEIENHAGSIRLNGVLYLAVSSGNGIGLYRLEE